MDVDYRPERPFMRLYLHAWQLLARLTGMAQGATQFCRPGVFEQVGGYDEKAWVGEDVDFYAALRRYARLERGTVQFIRSPRVQPSCRRFDKWPLWKVLIWTNLPLHRIVSPTEESLGRLALTPRKIDVHTLQAG